MYQKKIKRNLPSYLVDTDIDDKHELGRIIMTKLRTGTNMLRVETGRWERINSKVEGKNVRIKMPREQRICKLCVMNKVEDETHFLVECEAYQNRRKTMEKEIQRYLTKDKLIWSTMSDKEKAKWLVGDDKLKGRVTKRDTIKGYIADIYQQRQRLVHEPD